MTGRERYGGEIYMDIHDLQIAVIVKRMNDFHTGKYTDHRREKKQIKNT